MRVGQQTAPHPKKARREQMKQMAMGHMAFGRLELSGTSSVQRERELKWRYGIPRVLHCRLRAPKIC